MMEPVAFVCFTSALKIQVARLHFTLDYSLYNPGAKRDEEGEFKVPS